MEEIITLENRASKLCEELIKFCKKLQLGAHCDVNLLMEVTVIGTYEDISRIDNLCKQQKCAKFSNIDKLANGFYLMKVNLE